MARYTGKRPADHSRDLEQLGTQAATQLPANSLPGRCRLLEVAAGPMFRYVRYWIVWRQEGMNNLTDARCPSKKVVAIK